MVDAVPPPSGASPPDEATQSLTSLLKHRKKLLFLIAFMFVGNVYLAKSSWTSYLSKRESHSKYVGKTSELDILLEGLNSPDEQRKSISRALAGVVGALLMVPVFADLLRGRGYCVEHFLGYVSWSLTTGFLLRAQDGNLLWIVCLVVCFLGGLFTWVGHLRRSRTPSIPIPP